MRILDNVAVFVFVALLRYWKWRTRRNPFFLYGRRPVRFH
jgi:hypothetical protein